MPLEQCQAFITGFREAMVRGLAAEESDLKMLPSFVTALPTGKERGMGCATAERLASLHGVCDDKSVWVDRYSIWAGFGRHELPRAEGRVCRRGW